MVAPLDPAAIAERLAARPLWTLDADGKGICRSLRFADFNAAFGFMTRVAPEDICDIVKAEPIVVQAMPRRVLLERLRMPLRERQQSPGPECYRPAHVLWVMKDKWARVDAAYVRFLDETLNEGTGPQQASLDDPSRAMLNAVARRDRMPVVSRHGQASWSAVSRELPEHRAARKASQSFFAESLSR